MSRPFGFVRVIVALIIVALVLGGAFRIGYGRGVAESPAIAQQMQQWQESITSADGATAPVYANPMLYRAGPMMGHRGFHPLGALLGLFFFGFLAFGFMRMLFFRPMMMHRFGGPMGHGGPGCGGPGGWHGPHSGMTPPWAQQPPTTPDESPAATPEKSA